MGEVPKGGRLALWEPLPSWGNLQDSYLRCSTTDNGCYRFNTGYS